MGFSEDFDKEDFKTTENFVCSMYGYPKLKSVNELRLELFLKKYKPKKN